MSKKVRQKAEKRLAGGKYSKSYRQLAKGFGAMQSAEKQIGQLRESAAGRALGAFHEKGMQLSKPWQLQKPAGILQSTEVNPYDYSPWIGKGIKTKKLEKRLKGAVGSGGLGQTGVKGQLGDLVAGRGFAPQLSWRQNTGKTSPQDSPYAAVGVSGDDADWQQYVPDYSQFEGWEPPEGGYGGYGGYGGFSYGGGGGSYGGGY